MSSNEDAWYDLGAALESQTSNVTSGNWLSCYICGRSFDDVAEQHIHRYFSTRGPDESRYVVSTHKRCHEEVGIIVR